MLNSKKVSDHHAIIPTMELAKTDLATLPESERDILTLAGARLLMATAAPHTFEAVTAVFECAGQSFICLLYTSIKHRYFHSLYHAGAFSDGASPVLWLERPF